MNRLLRRRLEMAARVCEFLRTHQKQEEGEEPALVRLEQLIERANALAAEQRAGLVASRSATAQRIEIRRVIEAKLLRFLMAAGVVAAHDHLELAEQFRLPSSGSHQAFLTAARGMLQTATAQKALLVNEGMKASLLDDLSAALLDFEKTLETSRVGRRLQNSQRVDRRTEILGQSAETLGESPKSSNQSTEGRIQPAAQEGQTPAGEGPNAARPAA